MNRNVTYFYFMQHGRLGAWYEPTEMNSRVTGELKTQLNLDRSMNQEVKRLSQETGQISAEIKYLAW